LSQPVRPRIRCFVATILTPGSASPARRGPFTAGSPGWQRAACHTHVNSCGATAGDRMGQLIEFNLNDGGTILVEVHETTRTGGQVTRGPGGDQMTERARHTFEDARATRRTRRPGDHHPAPWHGAGPRRGAGRVRPGPERRSRRLHHRRRQRNRQLQNRHDLAAHRALVRPCLAA